MYGLPRYVFLLSDAVYHERFQYILWLPGTECFIKLYIDVRLMHIMAE